MTEGGRQCGLRSGVNSTPGFVRLQTPIVRSLLITPYLNITIPSLGPCTGYSVPYNTNCTSAISSYHAKK